MPARCRLARENAAGEHTNPRKATAVEAACIELRVEEQERQLVTETEVELERSCAKLRVNKRRQKG